MAVGPKSFWQPERELEQDPSKRWRTTLDETPFATEGQLIHIASRSGISLPAADQYELWELAAACGVHLIETWQQHDEREVIARAQKEYEEHKDQRDAKILEVQEQRKQRALERKRARQKVT